MEMPEQEVEEIRRKHEESEQYRAHVEEKLVEGALTAASHAVGILKSHVPGLDVSLISQGYACDGEAVRRLFEENRPMIEPFVEKLNLSVGDDNEE